MAAPPRQLQSVYDSFPDDDSTKEVYFQAAGLTYSEISDRHVLLWWLNGEVAEDVPVTQVVQLTVSGIPHCEPPNYTWQVLAYTTGADPQLAKDVKFEKKSTVNNCRVWTRDLLEAMVERGLISKDLFAEIDREVPLSKRKPEA